MQILNEHKDIHLHHSGWFLCTYYLSPKKNVTVRNAHTAQCTVLCGILHKYANIYFIFLSLCKSLQKIVDLLEKKKSN